MSKILRITSSNGSRVQYADWKKKIKIDFAQNLRKIIIMGEYYKFISIAYCLRAGVKKPSINHPNNKFK